ncbi:MAG: AraC family transcriptional regulator [Butyrivibrio sp.]|nr:AraC family transcriptional regulator [Butyrivibrio sp.]
MNSNLFLKLIANLLSVSVFDVTDMDETLKKFEEKYCFNKTLQPMYTANALHYLLNSAKSNMCYEVVDYINVSIIFFILENRKFIIGPYVKTEYSEKKLETILMNNNISGIRFPALRLYYTALPILNTNHIQFVINACLKSLTDTDIELKYRLLSGFISDTSALSDEESKSDKNYSEVYKRYDTENHFLSLIRLGDVENVSEAFKQMASKKNTENISKEMLNYYTSPSSIAIIRALSRKAAEESGLSVITIDSITQKYVQKMSSLNNSNNNQYIEDMIVELTSAVRNHILSCGNYSEPVQKAIEYINLHLSQNITISELAIASKLSESHLSKIFKQETGTTISSYIARLRCKKAAQLLSGTDLPIQEISSFVGYYDNNYFVKVFKKIYEKTPSEYRQK